MKYKDFTGGMNTYDPPEDIGDGELEELLNACYDEGRLLRSRYGFQRARSATSVRKIYPFYVGTTLHLIYTASGGLYDNGTVLDASFTGAFIADEYRGMLYICNGTYYKRYDGTTLYNVGVDAPDAPTVTASDRSTLTLDDFEDGVCQYAVSAAPFAGGATGAVARTAVAGEFFEGAAGIKITCEQGKKIKVTRTPFAAAQDWTAFSGGAGTEDDYITFMMKVDNPDLLKYMQVIVDVDDGDFDTNYYSSGKVVQGEEKQKNIGRGHGALGGLIGRNFPHVLGTLGRGIATQPVYMDAGPPLPFGVAGEWVMFDLAKADFEYQGTAAKKGWGAVKSIGFVIWANADTDGGDLVVYVDDGKMVGAASVDGGFYGRYYFVACYANETRNEFFEVSKESEPVDCDVTTVDITVPNPFPDAQASHYHVWARREDWEHWFMVADVAEGTTTYEVGFGNKAIINQPELTEVTGMYPLPKATITGEIKTRGNSNNSPPLVPDFVCMHRGKMFMVSDNVIAHSKPGMPWASPADYWLEAVSSADPIQGMYSDGSNLTVHSKSSEFNYINAGDYDAGGIYMGYMAKARRNVGCVARHSIHSGIYASSLGIATFDGQDGLVLSDKIRKTFRAISGKGNLHAVVYEDMYLLINPGGYSIVMQQVADGVRFYLWSFVSTARCCCVDAQAGRLYVGTDTGVYWYSTSTYMDTEGAFTFRAKTKIFEYAEENRDAPVERATVKCDTGNNDLAYVISVDEGSSQTIGALNNTAKTEEELHLDMGSVGSYVQITLSADISRNAPIRVYQIEVS